MSSPQTEDGYTRIANELLDAILRYPFSKRELNIVFAVIRKTYGYNKKSDDMTLTQLAELARLDLAHVSRTVSSLSQQNVLLKQQGRYGYVLGINKKYSAWTPCRNSNLAKTASEPCQNSNIGLPKQQPQKTTPKDNTKEIAQKELFVMFWSAYPKKKSKGQAEKTWDKLKPNEQLVGVMLTAIERAKTSSSWTDGDGKFIPHPSTWLNAKGWEDDISGESKPYDPRDYA